MTIPTSSEDRIIELEIRLAQQENQIEELSTALSEQWKTIDQLSIKLTTLTDRFLLLEEQTAPDIPVTRPPHW